MGVGAAIVGGSIIGGIGSIVSGRGNAKAAKSAAETQRQGTLAGIDEQRRQFDITQESLQPFQEAGVGALGQQQALLGLSGQDAQQQAFAGLENSPGQQFLRDRQQKALLRNASAIGGLGGGNVRTALQEQAVGFGQQDIQNQFGRLGQLAGQGQAAATNIGQFGAQTAGNVANLGVAGSEARASGILGAQQARSNTIGQVAQLGGMALGAFNQPSGSQFNLPGQSFSDRRLKKDIKKIGSDGNGNIYEFRYNDSDVLYIGRMAQELKEIRPDAVSVHESGFLQVINEFASKVA